MTEEELLAKCETLTKDVQGKDKQAEELERKLQLQNQTVNILDQKNKQLMADQKAMQQYIQRLNSTKHSSEAVVGKVLQYLI